MADSDLSQDYGIEDGASPPASPKPGLLPDWMTRHQRARSNKSPRVRAWMLVYYPSPNETIDAEFMQRVNQHQPPHSTTRIRYAAYQLEKGNNGEVHMQAYLEYNTNVYEGQVRRQFINTKGVYLQPAMAGRDACVTYCSKDSTRISGPFVFGEAVPHGKRNRSPASNSTTDMQGVTDMQSIVSSRRTNYHQGARSDIHSITEAINSGSNIQDVMNMDPKAILRMPNGIRTAIQVARTRDAPKDRDIKVVVLFGKTGTGKTSGVVHGIKEPLYTVDSTMLSVSGAGAIWWEGYNGEDAVLWDDYHNWLSTADLLRYMDRYTVKIQSKGGSNVGFWKRMFITSNLAPWTWKDCRTKRYPEANHRPALLRRMHTIAEVKHDITILYKLNGRVIRPEEMDEWCKD